MVLLAFLYRLLYTIGIKLQGDRSLSPLLGERQREGYRPLPFLRGE